MENQEVTVFPVKYRISNNLQGGVSFNVNLFVDVYHKKVSGSGTIFQATNPPLNIPTALHGDYSYMATTASTNILIVAEGINPLIPIVPGVPNAKLRIVLDSNWKTGTAYYSYLNEGQWIKVGPQRVEAVEISANDTDIEKLADTVNKEEAELTTA